MTHFEEILGLIDPQMKLTIGKVTEDCIYSLFKDR